jgi:hypothetical protein
MHDLLLAGGPGLFCILLVLGHFLMRGVRARRQAEPAPLDEGQAQ